MSALFACSRCFSRHPFEELSQGQQLCKECRGAFPIVKCTYCRSEFQQESKGNTCTICKKCEFNVKQYGKPSACEYCNIIAAFIGNKCQRCTNSEKKYGPPVTCEQCKQKCAFDRKDEDKKKVDGKMLCWLCTLSYRRALAKTKHSERHSSSSKSKEQQHNNHHHNKRPQRPDVTKVGLGDREDMGPVPKVFRPMINRDTLVDPNSSDHVVAITELREQVATLQKQLLSKDHQLLLKEKQMTELKANQFRMDKDFRVKLKTVQKEHEAKVESIQQRLKASQKEVSALSSKAKGSMEKEIVTVETCPPAETGDLSETLSPTGGAPMNEMIQLLRLTSMKGPLAQIKKEKKPMAKVSIPGMSTVFGDASPCRRVVWTLVLLVCFSIATIQLKDRVEHYLATPVTVNVRVTMNNSLRFPALTVCNKNSFNMTQFNLFKLELAFERNLSHYHVESMGLKDLIGFRGMNAKQLWDSLAHDPNKIILEFLLIVSNLTII
uniref:EOG090X02IW n=1 Tax=Evadne anonyx TaxID=141404 RepID=A0A9N6WPT5_9CRUS|nr:EOG090X02IW [Evadne anonyx]